jgi:hypothetical protein
MIISALVMSAAMFLISPSSPAIDPPDASDGDVPLAPVVAGEDDTDASEGGSGGDGLICKYFSSCTGSIKWGGPNGPAGCTRRPLEVNCHGKCSVCELGGGGANLCTIGTKTCTASGSLPKVSCGFTATYACTTTAQPGQPPTGSDPCYCDLHSPISPPGIVCTINQCQ